MNQSKFTVLLRQKYLARRSRNPHYSLRAFARHLCINPSAVSEIFNGKRQISKELATRLLDRLAVGPDESLKILHTSTEPVTAFLTDDFYFLSQWQHLAILSLVKLKGFKSSPHWVSKRLGITEKEANEAIERLLKLKLLKRSSDGTLTRTAESFSTSDGVSSLALRAAHQNNFELAERSLLNDSVECRDFTAVTMAINEKNISKAKRRIRKFQDSLSKLLETGEKTAVYKLCIQLFPLTNGENHAD